MSQKIKKLQRQFAKTGLTSVAKRIVKGNKRVRRLVNSGLSAIGIDAKQRRSMMEVPRAAMALFGERKKHSITNVSVPVSSNTVVSNTTFSEVVGKISSQYAGSTAQGVRIRGCQPLLKVANSTAKGKVLAPDVATTITDGPDSALLINPTFLNGPLLTQASNYTMFAFRKFKVEYVSTVASIYAGEFAICYSREPTPATLSSGSVPASFAEAREVVPSASVPFRAERMSFEWTYDGQQLFYIHDPDVSTTSDDRLSIQGQLRGYSPQEGNDDVTGYLTLSYEIDLFYPTINTIGAFAATHLHGLTRENLDQLRLLANQMRERKVKPQMVRLSAQRHITDEEFLDIGAPIHEGTERLARKETVPSGFVSAPQSLRR